MARHATPQPPEKPLPQNMDAERGILGSILIDPKDTMAAAVDAHLMPADFYGMTPDHGAVYSAALDLYNTGHDVDLITIVDEIERREQLDLVGGYAGISALSNNVPTSANVGEYIEIVKRCAVNRRMIRAGAQLVESGYSNPDLGVMLEHFERVVEDVHKTVYVADDCNDCIRPLGLAELLDQPPPELLVDHLLMEHGVSMIAGDGGSGKSLLLADLAIHIALGEAWNGRKVKQGAVLIVAGEGGQGFAWRVKAWLEQHGMTVADLPNFYIIPRAVQILDEIQRARLIAYAQALPEAPVYIAIETLSQTAGGADQNDNGEMATYVSACREIASALDAHVTFTHHALKTGNGYRGASALKDDTDTTILVSRDGDVSIAHCEKQRDGWEYFADFTFTGKMVSPEGAHGLYYGVFDYTGIKTQVEKKERPERLPDSRRYTLEAIARQPGIKRSDVVAYCEPHKLSRSTVQGAIKDMINDGWITEDTSGLSILPACPVSSSFVQSGHSGLSIVRPVQSSIPKDTGLDGQTGQSGQVGVDGQAGQAGTEKKEVPGAGAITPVSVLLTASTAGW